MTKVLYPGSFDPITKGHMNIVEQASELFDEVVIAVLQNKSKSVGFFTLEERLEIVKELYKERDNIKVVLGGGAAADLALLHGCKSIIRGIRGISDYEHEVELTMANREISNGEVNTILLFADKEYQFISSSMVKEVFDLEKDISRYVNPLVNEKMLMKRMGN